MSIADLKARLADIPGIESLTMTLIGGHQVFGFNGLSAAVDPLASDQEIETAIRNASRLPAVNLAPQTTEARPMSAPAPGSFAASLRAMMDEARQGVVQARAVGLATVQEAVGELNKAKAATAHVAGTMAQTIKDEAASVLSELGQISNDLGV